MLVVAATERELAHVRGVETFVCGIGPVEAALRTAQAIAELEPDAVLHIGIAGARGIPAPALVLGSASVYCDVIDPSSLLKRIERIEPDAALLARVRAALPEAHVLPIATAGRGGGGTGWEGGGGLYAGRAPRSCGRPPLAASRLAAARIASRALLTSPASP